MIAEQFEMPFMREIPVMSSPAAIVQVIDDGASYPLPDLTPLLTFLPDRTRSLFAARSLDTRQPCAVCSYPTENVDGLCSLKCRSSHARGRGTMESAHIYAPTHRQIVGESGSPAGRGGVKRNFTMDNQKILSN